MASLDSLNIRNQLAEGVILQFGTDEPIAMRIRKASVGTVTSVTVTTATNIVLISSDGGTDTYAFATYTTIGAVADAINADGIFEAKVLDSLRSQASASTLVDGAIAAGTDANGVVVWDAFNDTSALLEIGATLSSNRDFDAPRARRVHLLQVVYSVNMGTAAADSFQVYLRRDTTETKVFGELSVDTTETTRTFDINGSLGISGKDGDEIFVRVKDAATLANAAGNFVRVYGLIE